MRKSPGRGALSGIVKRSLKEHGEVKRKHIFVIPEASDHLLRKLKLPPEKLRKAIELEAHSIRLFNAMESRHYNEPITVKSAKKIIEVGLKELPRYAERRGDKLSSNEKASIANLTNHLNTYNAQLRNAPEEFQVDLPLNLIRVVKDVHLDEVKTLLGKKKFNRYFKALIKTREFVAGR